MNSPPAGEIISNYEYFHGDGWAHLTSSTSFKRFMRDPAAFRWPLPMGTTPAMNLGTAAHSMIHQPERVAEDIVELPPAGFRTKVDKEYWAKWLADLNIDAEINKTAILNAIEESGKTAVTEDQYKTAQAIALSVRECAEAQEALKDCLHERSFRTGTMKARPDAFNPPLLIDTKTTSQFDRFYYTVRDYKYNLSLAWYEYVLSQCNVNVSYWLWIAVESTPYRMAADGIPRHRVRVWMASDDLRQRTLSNLFEAMARWHECIETGTWPQHDYSVGVVDDWSDK